MLFRPHRLHLCDYPAHRIVVIKPSALGDIIHALPVLTALRRRFPAAHISWVVNRSYEPLLAGHPDLTETIPFDRGLHRRGVGGALKGLRGFVGQLRERRFDLVIDLQGLFRSGLMTRLSGAPRRVGLSSAREGATLFYTDVLDGTGRTEGHAVGRYLRAAGALGAAPEVAFRFPVFEAEHAWAEGQLSAWQRPWIMAAVGSRWPTKRWPPSHFGKL